MPRASAASWAKLYSLAGPIEFLRPWTLVEPVADDMPPLDGISVLVTRPADQSDGLVDAIEQLGGTAIRAPMIVVAGLTRDSQLKKQAKTFKRFDSAIFVSKNAVDFGLELVDQYGSILKGKQVFAVGLGTAGALRAKGIENVNVPSSEFSSEGLLRLDGLAQDVVENTLILVFRGVGGRELLATTLRERGAEVIYCECYERLKPDVVLATVLNQHRIILPDVGLATSIDALVNLIEKIEDEDLEQLFDMQMLVVGSRVGHEVASFGFTRPPVVVENPSDESIIKHLIKWAEDES
jgi:uroporphyrinogen-III synthase